MKAPILIAASLALECARTASAGGLIQDVIKDLNGKSFSQINAYVATLPRPERLQVLNSIKFDRRIIGGIAVDIKDFEWQVALVRGYAPDPVRSQFCGGTLIAQDVVLTAAHCVDNSIVRKDASRIDVIDGTAFYAVGGERLHVKAIFIHPQWNASTNDYDFALLKLASLSTLGKAATLQSEVPRVGIKATVSGWGALSEGGNGSPDLLAATVPLISTEECNKKESYNSEITSQMLCAGERDGGIDSCQGDSGGPLVVEHTPFLIGVVSFGEGCARSLKYGVYARVSAAIPWIHSFGQPGIMFSNRDLDRLDLIARGKGGSH
jgi:transmembrane serine protease 11D